MKPYPALLLCIGIGFLVSWLLGYVVIPWLHKLKFGVTIRADGPNWHKNKTGTPTMGGFLFIVGSLVSLAIVLVTDKLMGGDLLAGNGYDSDLTKIKVFGGLIMAAAYGIVGFADDYVKVIKKRNEGLNRIQKSVGQIVVMTAFLATLHRAGATFMFVPFAGMIEMPWYVFWPLGYICMSATVNAVNFTDGVDGLCASVTMTSTASLVIIAILRNMLGMALIPAAVLGALAGYLIWNWHPARVMMGDLGALFLGGVVIAVAYCLDSPWVILLSGIIYVIEFMSDILQGIYFRATHGKRLFLMAPIHHHFEKKGWSEYKICGVFSAVNALGGAVAILLSWFGRAV